MTHAVKDKGELVFAGLALVLGISVLIGTSTIDVPLAASNVGPRFFPYAVGILLTVSALFVVIEVLRGKSAAPEESELVDPSLPFNRKRVALLVLSVLAFIALLDTAGYVVAASVAFFGIATVLGARHKWRSAVAAVLLSLAVYLLFTGPLGIYLPPGLLDGLL